MHNKRWYDLDPTISLSVSLLRNCSEEMQQSCASYIIDYAKENGVELKSTMFNDAFNYILKRWYDQNKILSEAFAYYEQSPFELQKEMALEVIKKLQMA